MGKGDQISYLMEAQSFLDDGLVDSLRISTRPDGLSNTDLARLRKYRVKTVEIGVQSMADEVLILSNRGHSAADTAAAIHRLKQWRFEVGVQLMIGLPGDSLENFLSTLDQIIRLRPNFIRVHPTLVLKESPLEKLWKSGRYPPLLLDEAIRWLKMGFLKLEKASVPIARMGLQPTKELEEHYLAGPYHPSLSHCVQSAVALEMAARLLDSAGRVHRAIFLCHPKEISNVRGLRNSNLMKLRQRFGLEETVVRASDDVPRECLVLQTSNRKCSVSRGEIYDSQMG